MNPLYGKPQADTLKVRETTRDDSRKYRLLLDRLGPCRRLVDIGAGWGQFLALAQDRVEEVWAVDESPDRVRDIASACPQAKVVVCRADELRLPDGHFDVAVTSQVLHEVKLFGQPGELARSLREIARVLAPGGRHLMLDHLDAGDGDVVVELPPPQIESLRRFESKYEFYKASHEELAGGHVRLSRRCLQDFLTKDWSLGTAMESMEMRETHNVFRKDELAAQVREAGLVVQEWAEFSEIVTDLDRHGGRLVEGSPWRRKFLLTAVKIARGAKP